MIMIPIMTHSDPFTHLLVEGNIQQQSTLRVDVGNRVIIVDYHFLSTFIIQPWMLTMNHMKLMK